jgi:hypothetical protein
MNSLFLLITLSCETQSKCMSTSILVLILLVWQMKCLLPRRKKIDTCHHASLKPHSLAEPTESLCIIRHVLFVHSAYIFVPAVHKLIIM